MNLPAPILRITDGTDSVDLISPARGWHLVDWSPSYPNEDIGYRQSPLASGRAPVTRRYDYPVEQMTYVLDADSQDVFIAMRRKLDRLLIKATDYWKDDWRTEPVWLEARSTYESDARYAVVVSSKIGPYPYPYGAAFANRVGSSAQDGISLSLEHTFWQDEEPGDSHCIEASAQHYAPFVLSDVQPTDSADDCYVDTAGGGAITLNSAGVRFGEAAASEYHAGVRFRGVGIASGYKILAAYVLYYAENNLAANDVDIRIYGEDADNAAAFTTYANFMGRTLTTAYSEVDTWQAHAAGTAYTTVDVTGVVQEILDRPGWVSGNALALIFQNQGSTTAAAYRDMSAQDSVANPAPCLHIVLEFPVPFGRSATCLPEVYVANKYNDADITHIDQYDTSAGAYSGNVIWTGLPMDLFPGGVGGPDNGDIVYFGSECVADNPRPFCSLVFDVGTAATYGAGDFVTWQYWNGAWVNFAASNLYDGTATTDTDGPVTTPFEATGVNAISWVVPTDWAVTVVNGVSGFWVRAVVTEATAITQATQQNRHVYSVVTNYLDIDESTAAGLEQLRGDLPLPIKLLHHGSNGPLMAPSRLVIGMRTIERGTAFRSNINLGTQNAAGVTIIPQGAAAFATSLMAPSGTLVTYTFAAAITAFTDIVAIALPQSTYGGRFHAFVRYNNPAGNDGDLRMRICPDYLTGFYTKASSLVISAAPNVLVADLGRVELPDRNWPELLYIQVAQTVAVARTINLIDLILIPADEWIGDMQAAPNYQVYDGQTYIADSVTAPKKGLSAAWYTGTTYFRGNLLFFGSQPVSLLPRKAQRIWYFMTQLATAAPTEDSPNYLGIAAEIDGVARYLNMRGDD